MRISDWSSDVCSADLLAGLSHYRINGRSDKFDQAKSPLTADGRHRKPNAVHTGCKDVAMNFRNGLSSLLRTEDSVLLLIDHQPYQLANVNRSEARRVGKEGFRKSSSRRSPYH